MTPPFDDTRITIYGRRAVLEALSAPEVEVEEVRVARGAQASLRKQVVAGCRSAGVPHEVTGIDAVRALSGEPRHDQGVVALAHLRQVTTVEGLVAAGRGAAARNPARLLALDGITNAQNAGMIARSAVASGIDAVVWPRAGTPWINGLVVKASAAAVLRCRIARCETIAEGLGALMAAGYRAIGLSNDAEVDLFSTRPPHRAVYVVGSESHGLSEPVLGLLDERVRIPLAASVESLNAAVAASILCFHVAKETRS